MVRVPLIGGAYQARSVIANAQRCVNYFPELNRQDSPTPFTYYQRPGLRPKANGPVAPVRGLYQASNGNGYAAIGQGIYSIGPNWALTLLGSLVTPGTLPVYFRDNGITMVVVDGSALGYSIVLATNAFAQIVDATGTFAGANMLGVIDTYMLWNMPGTNRFGSTLSNVITFDALYFAAKATYPDPLVSLLVNRHQIILLGSLKSEIWYNAGNAQFPFTQLPGAYIEHGCAATFSAVSQDVEAYWLGRDLQGLGVVFGLKGYDARRISNHALEFAIQNNNPSLANAVAFAWQQGGHVFYSLTIPSIDQTWVYDASLGEDPTLAWHQESWTDANGTLRRHRGNCFASINGLNVCGDWENGTIYHMDPNYFVDTVSGIDSPISCVRGFPHVLEAGNPFRPDELIATNGRRVQFAGFYADLDCGNAPLDAAGNTAQVWLRWSDDYGHTFGNAVLQPAGGLGQYGQQPQWQPAGIARYRMFELGHSIAGPAALNGAWVDATVLAS